MTTNTTSSTQPKTKKSKSKRNKLPKGKSHYLKYEPNNQNQFVTYNFSELKRIIQNDTKTKALSKVKQTLATKNKEIAYLKSLIVDYENKIETIKEDLYFANNLEIDRYNSY